MDRSHADRYLFMNIRFSSLTLVLSLGIALFGSLSAPAANADDSDMDALNLADAKQPAEIVSKPANPYHLTLEVGAGQSQMQDGSHESNTHTALALRADAKLAADWRYMLDYRVDIDANPSESFSRKNLRGSLKEGFVTRKMRDDTWFDAGRINVKGGVGMSYNPSDFFRANAQLNSYTPDPAALRDNRLGTVAVRLQSVWDQGSFSVLFSPKLSATAHDGSFDLALNRTNPENRWQIKTSVKLTDTITPEFSLYHETNRSLNEIRMGFNLSTLLSPSLLGYVEWAGGRSMPLLDQALQPVISPFASSLSHPAIGFHHQATVGLTWNALAKFSVMGEYLFNQEGLNRQDWRALSAADGIALADYWRVRSYASATQNPITREAWLVRAAWQDALLDHFDITGFVRGNPYDSSSMYWLEGRYHLSKTDIALSVSTQRGTDKSEFGILPMNYAISLNLVHYF